MTVVIDGRGMEPPEPLERTLAALAGLAADGEVLLRVNCHPRPLFDLLVLRGYGWTEAVGADGTHEVRIRKLSG